MARWVWNPFTRKLDKVLDQASEIGGLTSTHVCFADTDGTITGSSDLTWNDSTKVLTINGDTYFTPGTANYRVTTCGGTCLTLQNNDAGEAAIIRLFTADGDGTDNVFHRIYAKGSPTDVTNQESMAIGYSRDDTDFHLQVTASGSGTIRPFHMGNDDHLSILTLNADGTSTFGGNVSFGDNNITNVGDISLDTISADATTINITAHTGINQASPQAMLHITPDSTTETGLFIKGPASYTGNAIEFQDSAGNEIYKLAIKSGTNPGFNIGADATHQFTFVWVTASNEARFQTTANLYPIVMIGNETRLGIIDSYKTYTGEGQDAYFMYDGTNFVIEPQNVGSGAVVIGTGKAGVDYSLQFNGETNDGVWTWMEDEDYFKSDDAILIDRGATSLLSQLQIQANGAGMISALCYSADNLALLFDAVFDSAWKSKDAGSNFGIQKKTDLLRFIYDSGVAVDGTITWNNSLTLDTSGNLYTGDGGTTNYSKFDADGDLSFVGTARIDWTKITANSVNITAGGTDATSVVANLQTEGDGNIFHLDEVAATPGIDMYVEFTSVTAFNWVQIRSAYVGSGTHALGILLYDWVATAWKHKCCQQNEVYNTTAGQEVICNHSFFVPSDTNFIGTGGDAGKVRIRFVHPMVGNASHDIYIDVVALYQ